MSRTDPDVDLGEEAQLVVRKLRKEQDALRGGAGRG